MTIGLLQDAARLAQGSKPELARPLINQLLQQDRDNPDVFSLLGLVASRTGDTDGAVDAFSRACQLDPDNPARLSNLGVSLKQAGRLDEAIAAIKKSLEIRPRAAGTLANLGSTLIAADRHEEALARKCEARFRASRWLEQPRGGTRKIRLQK
jgi:Flp pilus assembly protein TadD